MNFAALIDPGMTTDRAYGYGMDAARNGANETNCSFKIFSRPEFTKAWERGNRDGLALKEGGEE